MNNAELQAIRGFLAEQNYEIEFSAYIDEYEITYGHWNSAGDLPYVLSKGLEDYLSNELGVHWRKARAKRNHWENFLWAISLDWELEKQIDKAVTYLEQLEKGETA